MQHSLRSCPFPETTKTLKLQLIPTLIPLLSISADDPLSSEFAISIAALIAEAAIFYGVDIFSSTENIDQTIMNLLNPSNSPNTILTVLNLIHDLLNGNYDLNPEIIQCFPQILEADIGLEVVILKVCELFAQKGFSEIVKSVILPLFFEDVQSLTKDEFIGLINTVGSSLLPSQSMEEDQSESDIISDDFDGQLLSFIIACMNDPDDLKSTPAMYYFTELQDKLGFIPEAVDLLYNNLTMDDGLEAGEFQMVSDCISTLKSIAQNHPEEMLEFIIPHIKQDLSESEFISMKRGLRGLVAISSCLSESDIEGICESIIEFLSTPMRKEAISTLENIALAHPEFYPQSLNSIFPFICFTEDDDEEENSRLRMQAQRSLMNLFGEFEGQIDIPCNQYIGFVYQMIQISFQLASPPYNMQDELNLSLPFTSSFFRSVESIIVDESESELNAYTKSIVDLSINLFLSSNEKDLILQDSFNIISSVVCKTTSSFLAMINNETSTSIYPFVFVAEIVNKVHEKCLLYLNEIYESDELCTSMIEMYSSLFSFINCKNDEIEAYKHGILEFVQSILPRMSEFLSSMDLTLSKVSWLFSIDILQSSEPSLFQEYLLKSAVETILSFDVDENVSTNLLGNIAYAFYYIFKFKVVDVGDLGESDFEKIIKVFQTPIEKESVIEDSMPVDLQNIALLLLRVAALTNLRISRIAFMHAVEIVQSIQEEFPEIFEEAQEMIAFISDNNPMNEEEEEDNDDN